MLGIGQSSEYAGNIWYGRSYEYANKCPHSLKHGDGRGKDAAGISGQPVADGKSGGRCAVLTACLIEDMGKMMGNGFLAQPQLLGDLNIGPAPGNQAQDLHFSRRQPGWID